MRKKIETTDTFKCPTCGSKVLSATGYCLKCKKKVKPSKKEENYDIDTHIIWPIITISFFDEYNNDWDTIINEAKVYLQKYYNFVFNDMQDVVYSDEFGQTIEIATRITEEQARKLVNDADWWVDDETIYLSNIQTNISFQGKSMGDLIPISMLESKKEINKNFIIEKSHGLTVIVEEDEKLQVGDKVVMSNSGLMMYSDKYKNKEYTIKDITNDRGFSHFDIGLPFKVEVLDVQKVKESKEIIFTLDDNIRINNIILEKDERIKVINKK